MNRLKQVFFAIPVLFLGSLFTGKTFDPVTTAIDINQSLPSQDLEWMEQTVYQCAIENDIPAMVVGIIYNGEIAAYVQSGFFARNSDQKVTPATPFQIASLSKMFTGILANSLILEGKLDVNAPITRYLPSTLSDAAKEKLSKTTVADLLHHHAGFPWDAKFAKRVPLGGAMYGDYDEADLIKDLERLEINPEKVGHFSYSNLGYGTIGYILQQVSDQSYEALLQEYIANPFGLENTTTIIPSEVLPTPYRPEWKWVKTKPWKMGLLRAGGGVFSSVKDLSRLMTRQMAIFKSADPTQSPLNNMREHRTSWAGGNYGYGMFESPARMDTTTQAFWHTGDVDGFASLYSFVPKYDMGIVILTSRGKRWMGPLEAKLKDRLLNLYQDEALVKR